MTHGQKNIKLYLINYRIKYCFVIHFLVILYRNTVKPRHSADRYSVNLTQRL